MIIPVKCVSCGKVLADKYRYYLEEVRKRKLADKKLEHLEKILMLHLNYLERKRFIEIKAKI